MALTRKQLADTVAARTGITSREARQIVDSTFDTIAEELAKGGEVTLPGFGKFSVSRRAARQGRNPSSGETIQIAASRAARFSAAKALNGRLTSEPDE